MSSDFNKKYKRPKDQTTSTTNPQTSASRLRAPDAETKPPEPLCPLLAKDSEWVDILQTNTNDVAKSSTNVSDEEEVLQLVECEDGPQMRPLALMFPGLLDKDPQTLQGMLNKAMSTTEVTRHLVDLGQKANFTFMKKADRLIPREKQWLGSLTENSNSFSSSIYSGLSDDIYSSADVDFENGQIKQKLNRIKKKNTLQPRALATNENISTEIVNQQDRQDVAEQSCPTNLEADSESIATSQENKLNVINETQKI